MEKSASLKATKKVDLYTVKNCFMFEEDEFPKPISKSTNSSAVAHSRIMEFRVDKPYRLSLYVQPVLKRKLDVSNSEVAANLIQIKRDRDKENRNKFKQTKKSKLTKEKINVSLFDEETYSVKKPEFSKKPLVQSTLMLNKECKLKNTSNNMTFCNNKSESPESKSNKNVVANFLPRTKQKKVKRSYGKKIKENSENETVVEPSSDQILKEMDIKKITTKSKKPTKEELEYEKWAENMNSAFDDIDKFELSINYG